MGGSIRCCPNCGEYVLPPAVQVVRLDSPPYEKAECVSCGWYGFTEDLRLKFIPTMLVAEPAIVPPPFSFQTIGVIANVEPGGQTSLTVPDVFTPSDGDMVVAVVVSSTISGLLSVRCGSTPMTLVEEITPTARLLSTYYVFSPPSVPSQVSMTVVSGVDTVSGIAAVRFNNYQSLSQSKSDINPGSVTVFDSGPTPTQTGGGHIAIASVYTEESDASGSFVFGDSFSTDLQAGDSGGPELFSFAVGHRVISDTSAVSSTGTYSSASDNAAMVVVFKP